MDLKSVFTSEIFIPRWLDLAGRLFAIGVLSIFGCIFLGSIKFGLLLVAILGVSYVKWRTVDQIQGKPTKARNHTQEGKMTAEEFLSWAMDRHQSMLRFHAVADVEGVATATREIWFERPNKYRITNQSPSGYSMTSVCDGARVVEFSAPEAGESRSYSAPASIADAQTMFMMHPMFCGSLFNRFFAGRGRIDSVVDRTKAPIEYGIEEEVGGEFSREVCFYGVEMYGHVRMLIGTKSGAVYRVAYDAEPIMQTMSSPQQRAQMERAFKAEIAKEPDPEKRAEMEQHLAEYNRRLDEGPQEPTWTYHTYRDIEVDGDVPAATFDTMAPDGIEVVPHDRGPQPPVPIGERAPDATIRDLQGNEVKLSDFRGQVVLLDLWATWCGPCRKGLPDTASLARAGQSDGFTVLAVSNEDPETIKEFLAEEGLGDLPAYSDANRELWEKYKINAIPTVIIIDAKGNLAEYLVGLRPAEQLRAAIDSAKSR